MLRSVVSRSVLAAVLIAVAAGGGASATEYYVDCLDGNDANDGLTIGTAKKTIQAAVDLATTPGDVVCILPGECTAAFTLDADNSGVTVKALGEVVITAGTEVLLTDTADVRVEGLTLQAPSITRLLGIANTAGAVIERCRFLEAFTGLSFSTASTNVVIRQCLFIRQENVGIFMQAQTESPTIERCTFARNYKAITNGSVGGLQVIVRTSALFENEVQSITPTDTVVFHCCDFFGENAPDPLGTNITDDPLFIDPDSDVYYVKNGSPLLDPEQCCGPIGVYGQGFHTSKDVSKDEPFQGATPWAGWIDSAGNALTASTLVELNDDDEVILKVGVTEAAIYSPVFDTGSQFTVIRSVDFAAFEDTTPPAGSREIIDAIQPTPLREVRIRTSMSSFSQDPGVTPPDWVEVDKQVPFRTRAQYVQMELVLRNDGD